MLIWRMLMENEFMGEVYEIGGSGSLHMKITVDCS